MIVIRKFKPVLSSFVLLVFAVAAMANEDEKKFEGCLDSNPEVRLKACTRLIESGKLAKELLPHAYNNRGLAKSMLGDVEGSLKDLDEALRLDPTHEDALLNRGYAHILLGDLVEARLDFNRAADVSPLSSDPYMGRAIVSIMEGDAETAILDLNKVIKFEPRNVLAYVNRGYAHRMNGDIDNALADFREALKLNPFDQDVQRNIDEILAEQRVPSTGNSKDKKIIYRLTARLASGHATRIRFALRQKKVGRNSIACQDQKQPADSC